MHKRIGIFGSTGSIGTQTLDVVRELNRNGHKIEINALTCNGNVELLAEQAEEFNPKMVAIADTEKKDELFHLLRKNDLRTDIFLGELGIILALTGDDTDAIVSAPVGIAGLNPTIEFMESGRTPRIALANKETLVTGGKIITELSRKMGVEVIPIDSEHSAIFQSLNGNKREWIEEIILTCSGGPFRGRKKDDLKETTVEDALGHPTWDMGAKITVDSATLMNKGLEIIEAMWLFGVGPDKIDVVVHPQSILHSAIQYKDGSIIAQMGTHNMRTPIQYALTYPERAGNSFERLSLKDLKSMNFEEPDYETFRCLSYAIEAAKAGGTYPTVLNGANEQAVKMFLDKRIPFLGIQYLVGETMQSYKPPGDDAVTLDSILKADRWARNRVDGVAAGMLRRNEGLSF